MAAYPKPAKGSRHNPNSGHRSGVRRQLHEDRVADAQVRQGLYDQLTLEERVAQLQGLKASKQRARLARQLFARDNAPKAQAKKAQAKKAKP